MKLHFLGPEYIIWDSHFPMPRTPAVLRYVPGRNDQMDLVGVEYLAVAGAVPEEISPGVAADCPAGGGE